MRLRGRLGMLVVIPAVALLGLTACGGGSGGGSAGSGDDEAAAEARSLRGVTVSGPITTGDRPNAFAEPAFDLHEYGYTSQEFLFGGQARAYAPAPGTKLGADGRWALKADRTEPFKSRLLVMRPSDPAKFSGNVWLTWVNVTAGFEIGDITRQGLRDGDAIVYVSAQKIGLDGVPGGERNGLRAWDPERYGTLTHPGDAFSFDIFTKAALLVGRDRGKLPVDPMSGLDVRRVLGTGASQSAIRLTAYLNGVQPLAKALDGALPIASFGHAASFDTPTGQTEDIDAIFRRPPVRIRDDLDIPVILVSTETEAESLYPARQPDSDTFRTWEIAGAAHAGAGKDSIGDVVATLTRDGLTLPTGASGSSSGAVATPTQPNSVDWLPVMSAARRGLVAWSRDGKAPPKLPVITIKGDPPRVQRDEHGNALGGIRMPELEVPVATYSGTVEGADRMASLFGSMKPFLPEQVHTLYPSRQDYLTAYDGAVDRAVRAGYFLDRDAEPIKAAAATAADQLFPR
ncbi:MULTISPECIES: alpha/beta hydrolase domain-containing protein [unclassified Pseudofrankia]|uniref:alpha/beta hydrolase domain-containing protein n=1 Tax=unclassified Pseudofrankia TaxID=2994372 RepID=UPI001F5266F6|nr:MULTISPECIES: alpha/beta hydrolase domain-containing protein [unclassified Pseudofrankia]MDT3446396.1 alpha/beta hydrolase domain-containing protein [Pseudofrankia sp. BMG5.37]